MNLETAHPIGTDVTTKVYRIGGAFDLVTGTVVDYFRGKCLIVETEAHGRLVVERSKIEDEPCGLQHP